MGLGLFKKIGNDAAGFCGVEGLLGCRGDARRKGGDAPRDSGYPGVKVLGCEFSVDPSISLGRGAVVTLTAEGDF
ncbi:hypothetical protein FHX48_002380 [Microbacterium halimionae]|uniref:Uncharacterized protein n=1 Tax=Microbacterium halimionae TaxID=1526413 RepID=A0A7W3JQR3_9MICO|nr:hypothetical protein [Microbacterium halimionae]MBA8817282.1 hypothetical protein [Microbacterium halimionae]NII94732.1 hypothetical protein [Microbacterium halimionae]